MDEETKNILRDIAFELYRANKLKALEMKYPKALQSKKDIDKIMEED